MTDHIGDDMELVEPGLIDMDIETPGDIQPPGSKVAAVMAAVPDHINGIAESLSIVAEVCVNYAPSEFELAQIVDELCTKFNEPKAKTSVKQSIKKAIRDHRRRIFKRQSIEFGSIPISSPLPVDTFPDAYIDETGKPRLTATVDNLRHLLHAYGVMVEYDQLTKAELLEFPGGAVNGKTDLASEAAVQMIRSMAAKSGLSMGVVDYLPILLDRQPKNRVIDWIQAAKWDGRDRVTELADTVEVAPHMHDLWPIILKMWLIQCVAAADGAEHTPRKDAIAKYESVLVLVGGQGVSKTSWLGKLVPAELSQYFADGLHLRLGNRDSEKIAISFWIVELGEVDATFRKSDIAQLKAFLSRQSDTMRLSYARRECSFKRRTSFAASVNSFRFLTDETGGRRFWPVSVSSIKLQHDIDIRQLWRQIWDEYVGGEQWWACPSVEAALAEIQSQHTEIDPVYDGLMSVYELESKLTEEAYEAQHLSCKEIIERCGLDPTKPNVNRAAEILRELGFERRKIKGKPGYYMIKRVCDSRGGSSFELIPP